MRDSETAAPTHGGEATAPYRRSREETARLGKEIYERDIRHLVETDHQGEVVAIDIDSGSYALGKNAIVASDDLRDQHPGRPSLADAGWSSSVISIRRQFPSESRVIEGTVNAQLEAVVTLPLLGPAGQAREVDAVVDTGFNGYLILPPMLVADLGLPVVGDGEAVLADGSEAAFDVYSITMLWDGQPRYVETGAVGVDPLVGMAMLDNHDLSIQVRDGGRVVIEAGL